MFNFFTQIPAVTPADAHQKIQGKNVAFIDVRSEDEYKSGHARGAMNIPLETVRNSISKLTAYDEVYVICRSGGRSAAAVSELIPAGITALNVTGGTLAWQDAQLPME